MITNTNPSDLQKLLKKHDGDTNNKEIQDIIKKQEVKNKKKVRNVGKDDALLIELLKKTLLKNIKKLTISKNFSVNKAADEFSLETLSKCLKFDKKTLILKFKEEVGKSSISESKKKRIINHNFETESTMFTESFQKVSVYFGIKDSALGRIVKAMTSEIIKKDKTYSFYEIATAMNIGVFELVQAFHKRIRNSTDISEKNKEKVLSLNFKKYAEIKQFSLKEIAKKISIPLSLVAETINKIIAQVDYNFGGISFKQLAESIGTKEPKLMILMKKILIEEDIKPLNKKIIFLKDIQNERVKIDAVYLMLIYAHVYKLHFEPKYNFIYDSPAKDFYDSLRKKLFKNTKTVKIREDEIIEHIENVFEIDCGEVFIDILIRERVLLKAFDYYLIYPREANFKYEILEFLIAKNFKKEYNMINDWSVILKDIVAFFPELKKERGEERKFLRNDKLKQVATSTLSLSDNLTLFGRSTFIFKEDLVEKVKKIEPFINEFNKKVDILGIYSLQNFWNDNQFYLEKSGIETLQELYSLVDLSERKTFYCIRYPTIVSHANKLRMVIDEENKGQLKVEDILTVKEAFTEVRNKDASHKENQEILGISATSYRQFFLLEEPEDLKAIEPFVSEINTRIKDTGIYSLQIFWTEEEEELNKIGVNSLKEFYEKLKDSTTKNFHCFKYPIVVSTKNIRKLHPEKKSQMKKETVASIFMSAKEEEFGNTVNRQRMGLSTNSYKNYGLQEVKPPKRKRKETE